MIVDKDYRITLPKNIFTSFLADDFVEVTISKGNLKSYFYLRVPNKCPSRKYLQIRRKLTNEVTSQLQIKPSDTIEFVKVKRINKFKEQPFKNNHFDLLSLDLSNIMVDTFTKDREEWCRFWSSSKAGGITKIIELKRFIFQI